MKKNKKIITGFASGLIALFALSACSGVNNSNDSIMEIRDYNGNVVKIVTNNIFDKYAKSSTGLAKYYDSVLETLVRFQYQNPSFSGNSTASGDVTLAKKYSEIVALAKNQVEADKETAKATAKTSGTSYNEEWEKLLKGKGLTKDDGEDGLREYYVYKYEKEEMETWYYKKNEKTLLQQYIGYTYDEATKTYKYSGLSDVKSMFPYHIRHILRKTAGKKAEYTRDVITSAEALALSNTVKALMTPSEGKSPNFGIVANTWSEDGSKSNYGDVGIVTPETSFVNEFKLGVYAYDAVLSGVNNDDTHQKEARDALGLNGTILNPKFEKTTVKDILKGQEESVLTAVPARVFQVLGKINDRAEPTDKDSFYPRNILWNRYLNMHNPFVITDEDFDETSLGEDEKKCFKSLTELGLTTTNKNLVGKNILVDDSNRVIIGVRSEYGIHFIIMERSIFDNTNAKQSNSKYPMDLETYYTTDVDKALEKKNDLTTYITSVSKSDTTANYNARAKTIKDAVKGYDKTYDYRLYETLKSDKITVVFKDKNLQNNIEKYIYLKKLNNKTTSDTTLNTAWRTYLEQLSVQTGSRQVEYGPAFTTGTYHPLEETSGATGDKWEWDGTVPAAKHGNNGDFCEAEKTDENGNVTIHAIFEKQNNEWSSRYSLIGKTFTYKDDGVLPTGATIKLNDRCLLKTKEQTSGKINLTIYKALKDSPESAADWEIEDILTGYQGSLVSDVCRITYDNKSSSSEWKIGGKCYAYTK